MLNCPLRYCNHFRRLNAVIANNGLETTVLGNSRKYNKDKGGCCKDISQTDGKRVEEWPKCDPPPPAWTANCPGDPQPPNYDPYRIKVPDVVVPPLPPSNAKWMGVVLATNQPGGRDQTYQQPGFNQESEQQSQSSEEQTEKEEEELLSEDSQELFNATEINLSSNVYQGIQDLFHNSPIIHPDYWKEKPSRRLPKLTNDVQEPLPKLGYHGKQKYMYAFHEPWKPLDRITLLAQAEKEETGEIEIHNPGKTDEQLT